MTERYPAEYRRAIVTDEDIQLLAGALGNNSSDDVISLIDRLQFTLDAYEPGAIQEAQSIYGDAGSIEIDEGAICSRGEDPGLYVQAWVWVNDDEREDVCHKCGTVEGTPEYGTVGDGFDGLCPSCADAAEAREGTGR